MENLPKSSIDRFAALPAVQRVIIMTMLDELEKADRKYQDDRMSPDEIEASLSTLECELMELHREVKRKKKRPDLMQKEAIQVLAMAFKFNRDVIFHA